MTSTEFNRFRFNLHVAPPSLVRVKGLFEEASSPPTKVPFEELESSLTKNLLSTNDNVLEEVRWSRSSLIAFEILVSLL